MALPPPPPRTQTRLFTPPSRNHPPLRADCSQSLLQTLPIPPLFATGWLMHSWNGVALLDRRSRGQSCPSGREAARDVFGLLKTGPPRNTPSEVIQTFLGSLIEVRAVGETLPSIGGSLVNRNRGIHGARGRNRWLMTTAKNHFASVTVVDFGPRERLGKRIGSKAVLLRPGASQPGPVVVPA